MATLLLFIFFAFITLYLIGQAEKIGFFQILSTGFCGIGAFIAVTEQGAGTIDYLFGFGLFGLLGISWSMYFNRNKTHRKPASHSRRKSTQHDIPQMTEKDIPTQAEITHSVTQLYTNFDEVRIKELEEQVRRLEQEKRLSQNERERREDTSNLPRSEYYKEQARQRNLTEREKLIRLREQRLREQNRNDDYL